MGKKWLLWLGFALVFAGGGFFLGFYRDSISITSSEKEEPSLTTPKKATTLNLPRSSSTDNGSSPEETPEQAGPKDCLTGDPFDTKVLEEQVRYLASDELAGRAPGTPGDEKTQLYMAEWFSCLGLTPGGGAADFTQTVDAGGQETANVIGYIPGADPEVGSEIIVIGGHHDHLGSRGNNIFNGANDNASGTVGVMALAKAFAQQEPPRRTLVFMGFAGEESGFYGSEHYVEDSPEALPIDDTVYMMNLDMIGTQHMQGSVSAYGSTEGTPARKAIDDNVDRYPKLNLNVGITADSGFSDYAAFKNAGIPYIYFETFDNPDIGGCWHRTCDTYDKIDYESMSFLVQLSADIIEGLDADSL